MYSKYSSLLLMGWSILIGSAVATAAEPLRVMTYNIRYLNDRDGEDHWKYRVDAVADQLGASDVFGLQEATRPQTDQIAERCKDYDWYGVGRDDGKDGGEFSPVFWRRDQFEVLDKGTFWLAPDPQQIGAKAWGANLPRICSWVRLKALSSGVSSLIMNTHFDHQSSEAREQSSLLIRRMASSLSQGYPVILMGDLNCRADSVPLKNLLNDVAAGTRFVDSRALDRVRPVGPDGTWNGFKEIQPGQRIDFVLLNVGGFQVVQHETLDPKTKEGRFASDHLPVLVTLAP